MTYNPAEAFINKLEELGGIVSDLVHEENPDAMSYDEFSELEDLRDDVSRATGYLVDLKFSQKPLSKNMKRVIRDMLMVVDQFNELCHEELD